MGYYSSGTFTARGLNGKAITGRKRAKLEEALDDELGFYVTSGEDEPTISGDFSERKMYSGLMQELVDLSKRFKNVFFHYEIEGEDNSDISDFFVVNGKCQSRHAVVKRFSKPKKGAWKTRP